MRNFTIHKTSDQRFFQKPIPPKPLPRTLTVPQRNQAYNIQHRQNYFQPNRTDNPPPRPSQPKPPVPMDVDRSIQSRQVDYMNRPNVQKIQKPNGSSNIPYKQQRLFNIEARQPKEQSYEDYMEKYEDIFENEDDSEFPVGELQLEGEQEVGEINFMTDAFQASLI